MRHIVSAALLLAAGLCLAPTAQAARLDADTLESATRGGRLYDNWLRELDEHVPVDRHPAAPATASAADGAEASWRCVSCHGWDYKGTEGMPGIAGMAGAAPADVIAILTDDTHGYGEMLHPDDLRDLAIFVTEGQSPLIATVSPVAKPVPHNAFGEPIYQSVCANCHGVDGQRMDTIPPLGTEAREQPAKALHNILNGHAGGAMPSFRSFDDQLALTLLATLQSLPDREPVASLARGGRLYDNWPRETNRAAPETTHPAYPAQGQGDGEETWRCRECHGWDYRGKDGAYATGRHATGIAGIAGAAGRPVAELEALLSDDTHAYGDRLTRRDLSDLAAFVSAGQFDMTPVVDTSGRIQAPDTGEDYRAHYAMLCVTCHGSEGHAIRTMPPLGRVTNENPWRSLHSVMNGHPGEAMPPLRAFPRELTLGVLSYVQTLPRQR